MPKTVILGAARTPFGKMGGGLASLDATDLGGTAIAAALERAEVAPDAVQQVVFGQVLQAGQGQIPSRQAQIKGGIPKEVPSETVNKVCASGLRSAGIVDQAVRSGDLDVAVAGGMESMSGAPYLLKQARFGYRMGDAKALDAMVQRRPDATRSAASTWARRPTRSARSSRSREPTWTSSRCARTSWPSRRPTRAACRRRSCRSRSRRGRATRRSRSTRRRAATPRSSRSPSCPARSTRTARTPPATLPASTTGPARWCSPATSGPRQNGRAALATIVAQAAVADDFPYLARTPANATKAALEKAGLSVDDIDLFEINEAFASVALNSMRMLGVDESKVNVNGGAIALGHPIGASGARILMTLVNELKRRGGGLGVAAICSGGGQGDAVIVEVNGGVASARAWRRFRRSTTASRRRSCEKAARAARAAAADDPVSTDAVRSLPISRPRQSARTARRRGALPTPPRRIGCAGRERRLSVVRARRPNVKRAHHA